MINSLIVNEVIKQNTIEYNILKALEEMAELSEVLLKTLTKKDPAYKPTREKLFEELGDVQFRLAIVNRIFGEDGVNARIEEKQQQIVKSFEKRKTNQ